MLPTDMVTDIANASTAPFESRLIEGDVLKVLAAQPRGEKFDIVLADPPYNIGKDFGNDSDKQSLEDYIAWTADWLASCFALLKDDGIIYVYGFAEILARVAVRYPIDKQRWLVWHYTNKTVPHSKFWQRSHESILCLWKSGQPRPSLEIDQIREPYTETYKQCAGKVRAGTVSRLGGDKGRETIYKAHAKGALPRDVIKIPALAGGAGASERWFMCHTCGDVVLPPSELRKHREAGCDILKHPTQKPMALTRRLLCSRINSTDRGAGGRVLIPFAGSGSECIVAQELGIDWLGIEINPQYVAFIRAWLAQYPF